MCAASWRRAAVRPRSPLKVPPEDKLCPIVIVRDELLCQPTSKQPHASSTVTLSHEWRLTSLPSRPARLSRRSALGHGLPALSAAGSVRSGAVKRPRWARAAVTRLRRKSPIAKSAKTQALCATVGRPTQSEVFHEPARGRRQQRSGESVVGLCAAAPAHGRAAAPIAAHGGLSHMAFDRDGDAGTAVALEDALAEIAEGEVSALST